MSCSIVLSAIIDLSIAQNKATATCRYHLRTLLDYLIASTNASTLCRKSNMIIKVRSDGSHLLAQGARSWAVGYFYCDNNAPMHQNEPCQGAMHQEFRMIKPIVATAAAWEMLTLFLNCQTTTVVRATAKQLGHPQPTTPTRVDDRTTNHCVCSNLQQNKSK